jgi:hypothetical protein
VAHDLAREHCLVGADLPGASSNEDETYRRILSACINDAGGASGGDGTGLGGMTGGMLYGLSGVPDTNLMSGDDRLDLFRYMLDGFKWARQDNQVDFHEMMIQTALPCIYDTEWDSDYDRILRAFDLQRLCSESFVICPRRFGKTVATAMFCAVYMYVVPDASIAIFSTVQRTSGKMMLAIYEFMKELPFAKEATWVVKNSETISITLFGNTRTMWCYPGKVEVSTPSLSSLSPSLLSPLFHPPRFVFSSPSCGQYPQEGGVRPALVSISRLVLCTSARSSRGRALQKT